MPRFVRLLMLRWLFRKTPKNEMYALIDALQMGLRRCAYDLGHCISHMNREGWRDGLAERLASKQRHWASIASPRGIKQYNNMINMKIENLEEELAKRREIMHKHDLFLDDELPF